jgi:hypothetical protein
MHVGIGVEAKVFAVETPICGIARPFAFFSPQAGADRGIGGTGFGAAAGHS